MRPRLIAIVGATATGKTALAITLAEQVGGEIVNADSRQVYRGMDIGTAKPTRAEQARVRHWLIDAFDPDQPCSLAAFLDLAHAALDDIWSRGKLPIVTGGTGQYIWALLEAWQVPRVPPDPAMRAALEEQLALEGPAPLLAELGRIDPANARVIDARNMRRVIRAIEVTRLTGRPFGDWGGKGEAAFDARIIGLRLERAALHVRVDARVDAMIAGGLIAEVRALNAAGFGCDLRSMSSIGYRQLCAHLRGELTLAEAVAVIKTETHRLVRMQHTWFGDDDPRIAWLDASAPGLVERAVTVAARMG